MVNHIDRCIASFTVEKKDLRPRPQANLDYLPTKPEGYTRQIQGLERQVQVLEEETDNLTHLLKNQQKTEKYL